MRPDVPRGSEAPTVELVVFCEGRETARELYDTPEEAADAADRWSEQAGAVCQVDDLGLHHRPTDIRDPAPDDPWADDD
jgi:hypothetical protein